MNVAVHYPMGGGEAHVDVDIVAVGARSHVQFSALHIFVPQDFTCQVLPLRKVAPGPRLISCSFEC
jgi:hypothetical protein